MLLCSGSVFARHHSTIWQESRSVSLEFVSPHFTILFKQAFRALKSTLTQTVLLQLMTEQTSLLWFSNAKAFHMQPSCTILTPQIWSPSKILKHLYYFLLLRFSYLNAWISNQQSSTVYLRLFRVCWLFSTTLEMETTTWLCPTTASMMESGMRWSWIVTAENSPCDWTVVADDERLPPRLGRVRRSLLTPPWWCLETLFPQDTTAASSVGGCLRALVEWDWMNGY